MAFFRFAGIAAALSLAAASSVAQAQPSPAFFAALRQADLRVATIGYRLTTANAALCRNPQPAIGVVLHALSQYGSEARAAADAAFHFESGVQVEAVVPGGPADRAGLLAGDSLVTIDGAPVARKPGDADARSSANDRTGAEQLIAREPADAPLRLVIRRGGQERAITIQPAPGCRTSVEMILGNGWEADADGGSIRIASQFLEKFDDAQVAVILAHELGHNILLHRAKLDAAKVDRGLLAEVGRNGRLFRQTEDEADRMSVYVLYNAGYDPASAARFWSGEGSKIDGGLFRARTHRSASARAKRIAAEAALIRPGTSRPLIPDMLALRDQPLQ